MSEERAVRASLRRSASTAALLPALAPAVARAAEVVRAGGRVIRAGDDAPRRPGVPTVVIAGLDDAALADGADAAVVLPTRDPVAVRELTLAVQHALEAEYVAEPTGVTTLDALLALRGAWRRDGRVVVWTNGVFDLLHAGHLASLRAARALGDVLVVGVNADETVRRSKGPTRPVVPAAERAELLAALEPVEAVVVFSEDTPEACLEALRPDVHAKGADYAPPHGKPMPEAATVEAYGGRIEFLPLIEGRSTSRLLGEA